ncbi:MAG: efflux RND transporter periplasmic adaptor subunit [Pseudomonadota bacterium]
MYHRIKSYLSNLQLSRKSIAITIIVILLLWIGSSVIFPSNQPNNIADNNDVVANNEPIKVVTEFLNAEPRIIKHQFYGVTEASREVNLIADVEGRVIFVNKNEGKAIKKDELIAKISLEDRLEQLARAKAILEQRQVEFKAAKSLSNKGLNSQARLAESKAALRESEAMLAVAELNVKRSEIVSPFDGILNRVHVEIGDLNKEQNTLDIATVVELDPLIIEISIPESMINDIEYGSETEIQVKGFGMKKGIVTYISKVSDPVTRSFDAEITIENPDYNIPEGITATIIFNEKTKDLHVVPSSILVLNIEGEIGVRVLVSDNENKFFPVEIIYQDNKNVFVDGLPKYIKIITKGQNYISDESNVVAVEG